MATSCVVELTEETDYVENQEGPIAVASLTHACRLLLEAGKPSFEDCVSCRTRTVVCANALCLNRRLHFNSFTMLIRGYLNYGAAGLYQCHLPLRQQDENGAVRNTEVARYFRPVTGQSSLEAGTTVYLHFNCFCSHLLLRSMLTLFVSVMCCMCYMLHVLLHHVVCNVVRRVMQVALAAFDRARRGHSHSKKLFSAVATRLLEPLLRARERLHGMPIVVSTVSALLRATLFGREHLSLFQSSVNVLPLTPSPAQKQRSYPRDFFDTLRKAASLAEPWVASSLPYMYELYCIACEGEQIGVGAQIEVLREFVDLLDIGEGNTSSPGSLAALHELLGTVHRRGLYNEAADAQAGSVICHWFQTLGAAIMRQIGTASNHTTGQAWQCLQALLRCHYRFFDPRVPELLHHVYGETTTASADRQAQPELVSLMQSLVASHASLRQLDSLLKAILTAAEDAAATAAEPSPLHYAILEALAPAIESLPMGQPQRMIADLADRFQTLVLQLHATGKIGPSRVTLLVTADLLTLFISYSRVTAKNGSALAGALEDANTNAVTALAEMSLKPALSELVLPAAILVLVSIREAAALCLKVTGSGLWEDEYAETAHMLLQKSASLTGPAAQYARICLRFQELRFAGQGGDSEAADHKGLAADVCVQLGCGVDPLPWHSLSLPVHAGSAVTAVWWLVGSHIAAMASECSVLQLETVTGFFGASLLAGAATADHGPGGGQPLTMLVTASTVSRELLRDAALHEVCSIQPLLRQTIIHHIAAALRGFMAGLKCEGEAGSAALLLLLDCLAGGGSSCDGVGMVRKELTWKFSLQPKWKVCHFVRLTACDEPPDMYPDTT